MDVLLAETSKTPFYIAGGVLAGWAVVLAALGLSRDRFPGGAAGGRGVMALSLVLMLGAMATAVATASRPKDRGKVELKPVQTTALGVPGAAPAAPPPAAPTGGAAPKASVQITASQQALAFDQKTVTAKAGTVSVKFGNPSQTPHNVTIAGPGGKVLGATKTITQDRATIRVKLAKGSYSFYCSVPGHRQAGMQGTLTVQ